MDTAPRTRPIDDPLDDRASTQTFVRCIALTSAVAAVIHFAVADMHYQEYWAFGVFMIGTALLQGAFSAVALLTQHRVVWALGALLNAGIIAVYVITRTVGDIVGPEPHEKEPIGFGDAYCTTIEGLLVLGCIAMLIGHGVRVTRPRPAGWTLGVTGTVMAGLLVVALLDGGPEMTMGGDDDGAAAVTVDGGGQESNMTMPMSHMKGMDMSPKEMGASLRLHTRSPAGPVTMPGAMHMEKGMAMVSAPCSAMPTAAQQAATVHLVNSSWKQAQRYRHLAAAKADGFVPITPAGRRVVHYVNVDSYIRTARGGSPLDVRHPQSLIYANTTKGAVLAATMYLTRPGTTNPPRPGGCLDQWHEHTNLCFGAFGTVVGLTDRSGECSAGSVHRTTQPMMHVWYVPVPGGPMAVDATDRQIVRAAAKVPSPPNATA